MASSHLSSEVKIENGANSMIGSFLTKLYHPRIESSDDGNEETAPTLLGPIDMPFKREYILRTSAYRPPPYFREIPQRMYCLLKENEFRFAGAFTEENTYF
jgi:hypothetical protein